MTRNGLRTATVTTAFILSFSGCVSAGISEGKSMFQRFEFGNDGRGEVRAVKVRYGDFVIPSGTANSDYKPSHLVAFSETLTIPIPDAAEIHWISADGKSHEANAPMGSFVGNPACFHGFRFFFADDRVDIYVLNRKGDCRQMQGIERTLVFSSAPR